MSESADQRIESDSMGNVPIPGWAYWGAQTQRAVDNFSVSEHQIPQPMIRALALIKKHASRANGSLKTVPLELTRAIEQAADEVLDGAWDKHFPIDVFQTGSGTSWNMNANEVIANRASDILGHPIGKRHPVHPNDHVNRGQSSNDVIPSAVHIADRMEIPRLIASVRQLQESFQAKADEFAHIVKIGRTHLQDAVPMTLGQEFGGYAVQMKKSVERIERTLGNLEEVALGGTAVGTGLNAHPDFADLTISGIAKETGIPFRAAESKFESIANRDAQVELAGALNSLVVSLMKIANDLRVLASGPRSGLGEIILPALQPGSSIMPGKINPVIPEMMIQVAAHVMGKVAAISIGGQNAPLELNMMNPLIAYETLSAIGILTESCTAFATRCVDGIVADEERCAYWIEWSLALVTPLATRIGYDKAAELAHIAFEEKRMIRDVVKESGLLEAREIDELLDPKSMV
jgi:fumarate hydratase, class II